MIEQPTIVHVDEYEWAGSLESRERERDRKRTSERLESNRLCCLHALLRTTRSPEDGTRAKYVEEGPCSIGTHACHERGSSATLRVANSMSPLNFTLGPTLVAVSLPKIEITSQKIGTLAWRIVSHVYWSTPDSIFVDGGSAKASTKARESTLYVNVLDPGNEREQTRVQRRL